MLEKTSEEVDDVPFAGISAAAPVAVLLVFLTGASTEDSLRRFFVEFDPGSAFTGVLGMKDVSSLPVISMTVRVERMTIGV